MEGKTMHRARGWESTQTSKHSSTSVFGVRETSKWCDGCSGQRASRCFCTEGLCSQVKHAPGSQPGSSCRAGDLLWSDPGWCGASSALGLGWDGFKLCHLATVPGATRAGPCWRGQALPKPLSTLPVVEGMASRMSGTAHRGSRVVSPKT